MEVQTFYKIFSHRFDVSLFVIFVIRMKHVFTILNVFNFHVRQTNIKSKSIIFPQKFLLTIISSYHGWDVPIL